MSVLLTEADISRALTRISHEILERNSGHSEITIMGIPTRGAYLGYRLAKILSEIEGAEIEVGTLDITLHRDDLRLRPPKALMETVVPPLGIEGRTVVLVDDVLFSGRTIRSALDALGEIGRPDRVQLAVLIDRGHRELPIKADFVGKNLPTSKTQNVRVHLREHDGVDEVRVSEEGGAR